MCENGPLSGNDWAFHQKPNLEDELEFAGFMCWLQLRVHLFIGCFVCVQLFLLLPEISMLRADGRADGGADVCIYLLLMS